MEIGRNKQSSSDLGVHNYLGWYWHRDSSN